MRPEKPRLIIAFLLGFMLAVPVLSQADWRQKWFPPTAPTTVSSAWRSAFGWVGSGCTGITSSFTFDFSHPSLPFEIVNPRLMPCDSPWEPHAGIPLSFSDFPVEVTGGSVVRLDFIFRPQVPGPYDDVVPVTWNGNPWLNYLLIGETGNSLCIYTHDDTATGHTFVQLIPGDGPIPASDTERYGRYPGGNPFISGGVINSDWDTNWDARICYPLTNDQYKDAAAAIHDELGGPALYTVTSNNCVDFAQEVRTAPGAILPMVNTENLFGISTPKTVLTGFKDLGNFGYQRLIVGEGMYPVGTVEINPAGELGPGIIQAKSFERIEGNDFEYSWPMSGDGFSLAFILHADAEGWTDFVGLPLYTTDIGTFHASTHSDFVVTIAVDNEPDLTHFTTVRWGEIYPLTGENLYSEVSFFLAKKTRAHRYSTPGTYEAVLVTGEDGGVHRFTFQVVVSDEPAKAPTPGPTIVIPDLPEVPIDWNPDSRPADPPPPLGSIFEDGFETGDTSAWTTGT